MQFVADGPDVPNHLLQAHEEGRVVLFCGAGISYPANLPNFQGLVDKICSTLGENLDGTEKDAYDRKKYDAALNLLEHRLPGRRNGLAMRKALAKSLRPNLRRTNATETHRALLGLGRDRAGAVRLVTTNFDRIFEKTVKREKLQVRTYAAPMLPIPKISRWNGLVYLHGLLPDRNDDGALQSLVVTSADFGLAYLTERWAARFVTELFRNYVVCFVGYSIDDPVLRYMMDALAADRALGESTPQAFAFGDCLPGSEEQKTIEWRAKGVEPILYNPSNAHVALHGTLKAWAETYRDGSLGKERIVAEHAIARPSASTLQDDFVGRMLWALSDVSGLPAKRFAEFNPAPALDWLEAFDDRRYTHGDLIRFHVPPRAEADDELRFSLTSRPAPYTHAPWMALASGGAAESQWDDVMFQLARWLTRHLNDPNLILWLAQRGGQLHDRWSWLIEDALNRFMRFELEGKTAELEDVRANAPNAIPSPPMQILWRLLLTGRVKKSSLELDLYRWKDRFKREGLTTTLRLELRNLLAPMVLMTKPFRWGADTETSKAPKRLKDLVDCELVLVADHVHTSLRDLDSEQWRQALPELLDDFQQLLRDALDLMRELGEADEQMDRSYWDMSSISAHRQNRGHREWVALIALLRDAWVATLSRDPARATRVAMGWFDYPYPTFKRLALFAASQDGGVAPAYWVDWLVKGDAWWLWSVETKRETMRVLALQGANLPSQVRGALEQAILSGPPRSMFREDLDPEKWRELADDAIWLRFAKLRSSGAKLGKHASQRFKSLSKANPEWRLAEDQSDEFSHWTSGTGDPDFKSRIRTDIAPRKRRELVLWLQKPQAEDSPFHKDTWRETCRTRFFHCLYALCDLAREGDWPVERWNVALQAWSEEERVLRSWRFASPVVKTMPDDVLQKVAHSVAWWLEAVSQSIDRHETTLLELCRRLLESSYEEEMDSDGPVTRAINHPVGNVTQALLNVWFKREPGDNDGLPGDIAPLFTQICDVNMRKFRHGRVLLATRLIALFRIDRPWTEAHLLPRFDWATDAVEAKAVWEGFLWSPRLYPPLLLAFKTPFLDTARHFDELCEHNRQFAAFLTYAALEPVDGYSRQEFKHAIATLPQAGLDEVAETLPQALEGAGEQREDYWKHRVVPFWQQIWPKSHSLVSDNVVDSLVRLCIAAGNAFPAAIDIVHHSLRRIARDNGIVDRLDESGLCRRFPADALRLLDAVVDDQAWVPLELRQCLDAIADAAPHLAQDPRYQRLREHIRKRDA